MKHNTCLKTGRPQNFVDLFEALFFLNYKISRDKGIFYTIIPLFSFFIGHK